jgi:hypothetical protein
MRKQAKCDDVCLHRVETSQFRGVSKVYVPLPDFENTGAKLHVNAQDDAFTDSLDLILTATVRGIKEVF